MITHFSSFSDKSTPNVSQVQQPDTSQSSSKYGWLPTALGTLGAFGGPMFAQQGGTIGTMLDQELSGQNPYTPENWTKSRLSGDEQAMYAAIPGGSLGGGIVRNAATRFIGGALGGAGAQAVRNVQQGQPITKDLVGQGLATGGFNTIIPGATGALHIAGKVPLAIGEKAKTLASEVVERKGMPVIDVIQQLFGGRGVSAVGGKAIVAPDLLNLLREHNIGLPPDVSPHTTAQQMREAFPKINSKLTELLKQESASSENINAIIKENMYTFAPGDRKFLSTLPPSVQKLYSKMGDTNLNDLRSAISDIGKIVNWKGENITPKQQFALQTWMDLKDLMESHLTKSNNQAVKDLYRQSEFLTNGLKNYNDYNRNGFPDVMLSKSIGIAKRASNLLSQMRESQNVARIGGGIATAATAGMPGIPEPIKLASLLSELALIGPIAFPGAGAKLAGAYEKAGSMMQSPSNSQAISKLLQQLGVRIPGLTQ